MENKISVIVPVYKVEPYLRSCIDSILAQTFPHFDLILIDDGSPDNCGTICDEYAAKDDRIIVIHQTNAGVSAARNAGIDWAMANSPSEWIAFVDSDDVIMPTYLEVLYHCATKEEADVVSVSAHTFVFDNELPQIEGIEITTQTFIGRDGCISFYREEGKVSSYVWGKLYKKELLKAVRFPIGVSYAEDEEVAVKLTYTADKVVSVQAMLYCYRYRESGAVQRKFAMWAYDRVKVIEACINFLEQNQEYEIAKLAEMKKQRVIAKNTLLAHGAKMIDQVPVQCKMPLWKAVYITVADTLQKGGLKFALTRVKRFLYRTGKKR